jgi:hypothetical protein
MLKSAQFSPTYLGVSQLVSQRETTETKNKLAKEVKAKEVTPLHPLATFNITTIPGTIGAFAGVSVALGLALNERRWDINKIKDLQREFSSPVQQSIYVREQLKRLVHLESFTGKATFLFFLVSRSIVPGLGCGVLLNGLAKLYGEYCERAQHRKEQKKDDLAKHH